MVGFLFGGNTGLSYQDLQERRARVDDLTRKIMGQQPKTWQEGVGSLLTGAAAGIEGYRVKKGMKEGEEKASSLYNDFLSKITGQPVAGGSASAMSSSTDGGPTAGNPSYRDAIASIESAGSGDYSAIGPTNPKLGRALGRYQVMEANIAPWSQEALGRAVSPDEFMKDPKIQDAVFDHQFGKYVNKYGPEGAAQAWFGGPGGVGKANRKDVLGTTVGGYGDRFMSALGSNQEGQPQEVASLDPSAGMQPAPSAIQQQAPGSGYVDPVVSAQPQRLSPQQQPMPQVPPQQVAQNAPQPQPQQAPQGMAQGLDPKLIELMNNPFLPEGQRATLQMMFKQQQEQMQAAQEEKTWRARKEYEIQQERGDPLYQAKLEAARREAKAGQGLINAGDGKIYDPNKQEWISPPASSGGGQFRFGGNSVEAQSLNGLMDSGALTPEQAQQLGAGKTIAGPNGEIMFMTPQGVFGQSAQGGQPQRVSPPAQQPGQQPQGQPQAAPNGAGMLPLTGPKTTVDERRAAGFADRMTESGALLDKYEKEGGNILDQFVRGNDYIPDFAENWMVSDDFQKFDQARRNFINSQLRRESGAIISPEEFDNANKQYLPEPGDAADVIEQKRRGRQTVIQGMQRDAGPTYGAPQGDAAPKRVQSPQEFDALPSGAEFIAPDGSRRRKQ